MVQDLRNEIARRQRYVNANRPPTYEEIMDRHRDTLANLNITLCKNCLIPIKKENDITIEYCEDCIPARQ